MTQLLQTPLQHLTATVRWGVLQCCRPPLVNKVRNTSRTEKVLSDFLSSGRSVECWFDTASPRLATRTYQERTRGVQQVEHRLSEPMLYSNTLTDKDLDVTVPEVSPIVCVGIAGKA